MSIVKTMRDTRWILAECHSIAQIAYGRWIEVEAWQIYDYIGIWRKWLYGMVTDDQVLKLPGVHRVPVSDR